MISRTAPPRMPPRGPSRPASRLLLLLLLLLLLSSAGRAAPPAGLESGLLSLEAGLLLAEERLFVECGDEWSRLAETTAKRGDEAARIESGMQFALAARCYEWGKDMRAYQVWGRSIVQLARAGSTWEAIRDEFDGIRKRYKARAVDAPEDVALWTGDTVKRLTRSLSIREFVGPRPGLKATRQAPPVPVDEDRYRRTPPRARIHMPKPRDEDAPVGGFDVPEDEEGVMWLGEGSLGETPDDDAPAASDARGEPANAQRARLPPAASAPVRRASDGLGRIGPGSRPRAFPAPSEPSIPPRRRPAGLYSSEGPSRVRPSVPEPPATPEDIWEPGETRPGP